MEEYASSSRSSSYTRVSQALNLSRTERMVLRLILFLLIFFCVSPQELNLSITECKVLSGKIENFQSTEAGLNASLQVVKAVVKSVVKELVVKKQGAERKKKSRTSRTPWRASTRASRPHTVKQVN